MELKNIKRMFLFLTLLILLVGAVSATDTDLTTDTPEVAAATTSDVQTSNVNTQVDNTVSTPAQRESAGVDTTDAAESKNIVKQNESKSTKSLQTVYTTTVSTYSQLVDKVEESKYLDGDEIIINLKKGNYYVNSFITWGDTVQATTLTINGNGSTFLGKNDYAFMSVYGGYTVNVKNATFKNFYKSGSGSVFYVNNYATLEVTSCDFLDNYASSSGGVIETSGKCTIDECYFAGNSAGGDGGAITNVGTGTLYVYDSIFVNGTTDIAGGAIANFYNAYVYDSLFLANEATTSSGAIYNHLDYLYSSGNLFYYNWGGKSGGAIQSWGSTKISNNKFLGNGASTEGGAISIEQGTATIYKNTFLENLANYGSAINIDGGTVTATYNTFQRNEAYYTSYNGPIRYVKNLGYMTYGGNTYSVYEVEDYQDTIYNGEDADLTLKYNDFDDRDDSFLILNNITSTTYGTTKTISGKLYTDDGVISGASITIYVNGVEYKTVTTSSTGAFSVSYKATTVGTNNVTAEYNGGYYFLPDSDKKTFTVNKATVNLTLSPITQKTFKDTLTITGKITNNAGTPLKSVTVKIEINDKTISTKTDSNGVYKYVTTANKAGMNDVIVRYAGNKNYYGVSAGTSFKTVARETILTVSPISQKTFKDSVTITGEFTDDLGNPRVNAAVKITINSKTVSVRTDSNGIYRYTTTASKSGINTVKVSYTGNNYYKASSAQTAFNVVARGTILTVSSISQKTYKDSLTVTGTFTDDLGNPRAGAAVKITINGKSVSVKADANGIYRYTTTASKSGINTVVVSYAENSYYKASSAETSFNVVARATKLTISPISQKTVGDTVTVTGTFKDDLGNPRAGAALKISINGKAYSIKADSNGVYRYTFTATKVGTNTVKVTYPANSYYKASSVSTTFTTVRA